MDLSFLQAIGLFFTRTKSWVGAMATYFTSNKRRVLPIRVDVSTDIAHLARAAPTPTTHNTAHNDADRTTLHVTPTNDPTTTHVTSRHAP